jgi:hypothetical protein
MILVYQNHSSFNRLQYCSYLMNLSMVSRQENGNLLLTSSSKMNGKDYLLSVTKQTRVFAFSPPSPNSKTYHQEISPFYLD